MLKAGNTPFLKTRSRRSLALAGGVKFSGGAILEAHPQVGFGRGLPLERVPCPYLEHARLALDLGEV